MENLPTQNALQILQQLSHLVKAKVSMKTANTFQIFTQATQVFNLRRRIAVLGNI